MKATFEIPSGVTPEDIIQHLETKGVHGTWDCYVLNIFRLAERTDAQYNLLCQHCTSFEIRGHQVRGRIIMFRKGQAPWNKV